MVNCHQLNSGDLIDIDIKSAAECCGRWGDLVKSTPSVKEEFDKESFVENQKGYARHWKVEFDNTLCVV